MTFCFSVAYRAKFNFYDSFAAFLTDLTKVNKTNNAMKACFLFTRYRLESIIFVCCY